jgi:glycosyltransferase involved in cell wall biosynthesis
VRDRRHGYCVVRRAGRYLVFPRAVAEQVAGRLGHADAVVEIWNGVPFLSPLWFRGPRVTLLHHTHQAMWGQVLPERLARAGRLFEGRVAPLAYRRETILTLSASSKAEIVDSLGLSPDRVHVVPPGIDERFTPAGPKDQRPTVLAVGRLTPPKRLDRLVRACAAARAAVPDLRLVIAGEGYERPNLDALVGRLGAASWVELPGRIDDDALLALYRGAWVVASASSAEGWGMTLTEAAACGTPAVATDIPGHRDAVHDGESGLLATSDGELTGRLVAVLTDDDLRARLAEGARKRAAELTWDAAALRIFAALAEDARRHPVRRHPEP